METSFIAITNFYSHIVFPKPLLLELSLLLSLLLLLLLLQKNCLIIKNKFR